VAAFGPRNPRRDQRGPSRPERDRREGRQQTRPTAPPGTSTRSLRDPSPENPRKKRRAYEELDSRAARKRPGPPPPRNLRGSPTLSQHRAGSSLWRRCVRVYSGPSSLLEGRPIPIPAGQFEWRDPPGGPEPRRPDVVEKKPRFAVRIRSARPLQPLVDLDGHGCPCPVAVARPAAPPPGQARRWREVTSPSSRCPRSVISPRPRVGDGSQGKGARERPDMRAPTRPRCRSPSPSPRAPPHRHTKPWVGALGRHDSSPNRRALPSTR